MTTYTALWSLEILGLAGFLVLLGRILRVFLLWAGRWGAC